MRVDLGAGKIVPRWVVAFFLGCAVVLIPWIVLMFTVPQEVNVPKHWVLVWGGFDCFLVLGFAVTAYRLLTRSPRGAVTAAMTGTMLLIDAWFDVLTTHRGGVWVSILMAVFAEIPCAVICFAVSRRIVRLFEQAKVHLEDAGFTVRNGRLVPPARRCRSPARPRCAAPAPQTAAEVGAARTPTPRSVVAPQPTSPDPRRAEVAVPARARESPMPGAEPPVPGERGLGLAQWASRGSSPSRSRPGAASGSLRLIHSARSRTGPRTAAAPLTCACDQRKPSGSRVISHSPGSGLSLRSVACRWIVSPSPCSSRASGRNLPMYGRLSRNSSTLSTATAGSSSPASPSTASSTSTRWIAVSCSWRRSQKRACWSPPQA